MSAESLANIAKKNQKWKNVQYLSGNLFSALQWKVWEKKKDVSK